MTNCSAVWSLPGTPSLRGRPLCMLFVFDVAFFGTHFRVGSAWEGSCRYGKCQVCEDGPSGAGVCPYNLRVCIGGQVCHSFLSAPTIYFSNIRFVSLCLTSTRTERCARCLATRRVLPQPR
jgi:hypothetical protein